MTDEMFSAQSPKGWVRTKLGDIVTFEYGKGLTKAMRKSDGSVPVYGSNGVLGHHSQALTNKPCIIVGRKGAVGAVHLSSIPCWPIDTTYFVETPEGMDLSFLFYLLSTLGLGSLDRSTAIPGLNRNDAYRLPISLPPSTEQHRIVAKIEELFTKLDAGIDVMKKIRVQLKQYRQAVLKAAFQGKLTEEWREKHKGEFEPASMLLKRIRDERGKKDKWKNWDLSPGSILNLPQLPEGWMWSLFGNLITESQNGVSKRKSPQGTPTHVLRLSDIASGKISDANPRDIRLTRQEIDKYTLTSGDLLCIRVNGSPDLTGRMVAFSESETWAFCDHFIRFRVSDLLSISYLCQFFNTQVARNHIESSMVSSAGQNTVSQKTIAMTPIPLPSCEEQEKIVGELEHYFSVLDQTEKIVERTIEQSDGLRQSILRKAFQGRLVPQDPSDEPAGDLLNQIKAERAKRESAEKVKKGAKGKSNTKQMRLI